MANRLSSVQSLLPVMRPASVPLWCKKDKRKKTWLQPGGLCLWPVLSRFAGCGEAAVPDAVHRSSISLFFFFSKFSFNSKTATLLAMFHSAFTIQPTQCHSYFTWHFPFNVPKQPPGGRRTTLLCVFECAARHLSSLCSHLVPLGPNMIMVVVNLFAEEAFAAKGA